MSKSLATRIGELMADLQEAKDYAEYLEEKVVKLERATDNTKKLHPFEVRQIRALWDSGQFKQVDLADTYDVNPATISRIVRGIYYA